MHAMQNGGTNGMREEVIHLGGKVDNAVRWNR